MKKDILAAIKLTLVLIVCFAVIYPFAVWMIAKTSPNGGKGEIVTFNGKTYYSNIGQSFTKDEYFWSRPSAVNYNAAGSGASNKAPSNADYLAAVQNRVDTFLVHNPQIKKSEIPVDLITASGSGLDPHFSVQAAQVQVKRIAKIRNIPESTLLELIKNKTEKPLFGIFGPEKINVLKLNIALDQLAKK
ncbi:K(+)-transporting ATPase subunit C [Sphingobacterium sp. SRCM116780]|uniref:K(+)-transporting ATPase subunit C n=1 Tax=Sphingobacterium sp. SRCM116780 TaxID=2907623 RepID=UPI001F3D76F4|nr:K(+)-transporting ATPase subunit C [Sphingobacterium sp. SRCM116780]UIR57089.1 K(+)-transporting ATPase subunit C [Sphingobacterium sp. SRCM116780]